MHVIHMPIAKNPYQFQLGEALEAAGVTVEHRDRLPGTGWFLKNRNRGIVLHLHWLHTLYYEGKPKFWRNYVRYHWKIRLAAKLGYPIVWTAHNTMPHDSPRPKQARSARIVTIRNAAGIIAHCDAAAREVERVFPEAIGKIHVVPIGSFVSVYNRRADRAAAREQLGLPHDARVFLSIGRIEPYKGLVELLRAFAELPGEHLRLVIGGRCENAQLKAQLEEVGARDARVVLRLAHVPDEELPEYMAAADVFVTPFLKILTSSSVLLGFTFGLPVVAPRLGCVAETITEKTGFLYEPGDSDGLRKALETAASAELADMGKAAVRVAEGLDWPEIGKKTAALYKRLSRPSAGA